MPSSTYSGLRPFQMEARRRERQVKRLQKKPVVLKRNVASAYHDQDIPFVAQYIPNLNTYNYRSNSSGSVDHQIIFKEGKYKYSKTFGWCLYIPSLDSYLLSAHKYLAECLIGNNLTFNLQFLE